MGERLYKAESCAMGQNSVIWSSLQLTEKFMECGNPKGDRKTKTIVWL